MPKSNLTWYKTKTKRILKDVKALRQKDIAQALNESQQTISYRINNVYEKDLIQWVLLLDMAGYEIKEKESIDD